jgi:hypothetical protein
VAGNVDDVAISVTGARSYKASGPLVAGDFVAQRRDGRLVGLKGAGTILSPSGGSARVSVELRRVWFFDVWAGRVSVTDRAGGIDLTLPHLSMMPRNGRLSGTSFGLVAEPWPVGLVGAAIHWSVTDKG